MKKLLLPIIFFVSIMSVNAQNISLKTIYPEPRVGQTIRITLDLNFIEEYVKETLPPKLEVTGYSPFSNYSRDILVNDTGYFQIGPYEFNFNNRKYKSDSLIIHVIEPLEKKEGVWIRLFQHDSIQFLIVEQYLSKPKNASNFIFTELIEQPIDGLEFNFKTSNTNFVSVDDNNPISALLGYSLQIYNVTNETGKEIKMTKKFFKDLPITAEIPRLIIRKTNKPKQKL